MKIHKSAFALVLSLVAFLAGCQIPFAVNGEQQSVNPFEAIGGLFTRETTKERTEYIAANPGDALAELLRADDQMILGSKHSGVYFYATLDTLAKRQKAVEAFLALAPGHADRVTKSKEIADLSDAILALEHEAWKKKFDQVDASLQAARAQAGVLEDDVKILDRQAKFVLDRIRDTENMPKGLSSSVFVIPMPEQIVAPAPGSAKPQEVKQ